MANERLTRYGFNPDRRCLLPRKCQHLLIRIPGLDEVFPNVGHRDRMHAAIIFLHRTIVELFQQIHFDRKTRDQTTINQRLLLLSTSGALRNELTKRSSRVQESFFNDANMSATDRAGVLFFLPHVLGHDASVIPENLRGPVLNAVAVAQQILIALSGARPYTKSELEVVFDHGYVLRVIRVINICNMYVINICNMYVENVSNTHIRYVDFFKSCEQIYACIKEKSYNKRLRRHQKNPDKYSPPKRFKRKETTWPKHAGPVSSTDETDDDDDTGGMGKYSHGDICLSHQHFVRQVVTAGSFGVHCTQGPEACHKLVMRTASARVRHLRPNTTKEHMLKYLFYHHMFEDLRSRYCPETRSRKPTSDSPTVRVLLMDPITGEPVSLGQDLHTTATQSQFLHTEARISRSELLDLVCDKLTLSKTIATYQVIRTSFTHA